MKAVPKSRYLVFFSLAIFGCALDLGTKEWVFQWLGPPARGPESIHWLWQDHFGLQTSLNPGALFGVGRGFALGFAAISVLAAAGILYWLFFVGMAESRWLNFALGCITGGILGNLYDRLGLHSLDWPNGWFLNDEMVGGQKAYAVRDWILWRLNENWSWPNFNIADSLLVFGAGMLLWHAFRKPQGDNLLSPQPDSGARSDSGAPSK